MHYGLVTILGGILAASAFIIARKPNAKDLIDKVTPYQGWIGFGVFFWGAWVVLHLILNLGFYLGSPIRLVMGLALAGVNLGVGFLLGFGLLSKWVLSKNQAAMARGQLLRKRLVGYQVPLGFCAIGVGAAYVILPYVL